MLTECEQQLNEILSGVAENLDIPPGKYRQAVERYETVGTWLENGEYDGCTEKPEVGPQGSFRLGTVVRPLKNGKDTDYDIDLVCVLQQAKAFTTPRDLKMAIGDRLKENADYRPMLDAEGRRCWTLQYAEPDGVGFHLDILPSLPDPELGLACAQCGVPSIYAQNAIAITEKARLTYSWHMGGSNPKGFADWFDGVNQQMFAKVAAQQRRLIVERHGTVYCSVEAVPNALIRTPLQRAIQILKRHRDMRFMGHRWEGDKPISIIVTTLAAKAYGNESDVYSTLLGIVARLERYALFLTRDALVTDDLDRGLIDRQNGRWWISNPVNPAENFADRWNERGSNKAEAFLQWINWVRRDIRNALDARDMTETKSVLIPSFGKRVVEAAIPATGTVAAVHAGYPAVEMSAPHKPWSPDVRT